MADNEASKKRARSQKREKMTITTYTLAAIGLFIAAEIIALVIGVETMSQFVIRRTREGSKFWKWFVIIFPAVLLVVALWLFWHWFAWCFWFGLWCDVDV